MPKLARPRASSRLTPSQGYRSQLGEAGKLTCAEPSLPAPGALSDTLPPPADSAVMGNLADVRSGAAGRGQNGVPFTQW